MAGIITWVYDDYGIAGMDVKHAAERVAAATGEALTLRYGDARGEYYLSADWPRRELTVESNELEDEDGKYLLRQEYAEYSVLVLAFDRLPGEYDTSSYLDDLRTKLSSVDGLTFLRRRITHSQESPELSLEDQLRILRDGI
jgi:hypothetical protein